MTLRTTTTVAIATVALIGAAGAVASTQAQVVGRCTASSVALSAPDRASFTWTLTTTWATQGSARIVARPTGSTGAFTTLATVTGFRRASTRTTVVSIPALASGSWSWRMEVTPPAGATGVCDAPTPLAISRPRIPAVTFTGAGLTADGWRKVGEGQSVGAVATPHDVVPGTSYVRFQSATGEWGAEMTAPAAIPASDVASVQAYRRSTSGLTGPDTTIALTADTTPPSAPGTGATAVVVGAAGATVGVTPSVDSGSGVAGYDRSIVTADGTQSAWSPVRSLQVSVAAGDVGGTLHVRACDRVGNCSASTETALRLGTSWTATPPAANRGGPRSFLDSTRPHVSALTGLSPGRGVGRLRITLNRPSEVTFEVAAAGTSVPRVTAWLGAGETHVRIPGATRATAGAAVTARAVVGSSGEGSATTTISLPAAAAAPRTRAQTTITPMRNGAIGMLYDMDAAVREVVRPSDGAAGLTGTRGALRQEPSTSALFGQHDERWKVGKVTIEALVDLPADEMAQVMRDAISDAPGHLIGLDEITSVAADPRARLVIGARIPPADPESVASRMARAFAALDQPSPYGGSWASRVHVYLAPGMTTAMATGRGPDRNLGRDRKPHFRTYRTVMAGLARAGGVWIEMYHGTAEGATAPFSVTKWQRLPAAVTAEYRRAGGDASRLHLLMTGSAAYPSGNLPAGCVTPQRCNWVLAESTPAGRALIANGVGGYRLAASARPFLAEWQARLP